MYSKIKRVIDFILALIALALLAPIMLIIAVLIKISSKGSVIFRQRRIGINKKEFVIYKFRTMKIDAPPYTPTHLLKNPETYLTKTGAWLKKTSLDELPQLINIIRGDMSFVGPRPVLCNQHDLILERDLYGANSIPVGLTGWAQVNGRNKLSDQEKSKFDGEYVASQSILFDFKIMFKTFIMIVMGKED